MSQISNDTELDAAILRISQLLRAKEGTPEFEELDRLADAVVEYEESKRGVSLDLSRTQR